MARLWCCLKAEGKKGERLIADKTTRGVRIASDGRGEARGLWSSISNRSEAQEAVQRLCGGGGGSVAELLRSLIRRSSANRVSAKFALMEFSEVRVRQVSYSRLYEP